jgi:hypothetical protein
MTDRLRRPCAYTVSTDAYRNWAAADRLHSIVGSFAEPYDEFLADGGWTEEEKPEAEYRLRQVRETKVVQDALNEATSEAVRNARMAGATWEQVGEALGITTQAAQKRFGGAK